MNILGAGNFPRHLRGEVGLLGMVVGHGIAALVNEIDFGAGHFGHALDDLADAPLDRFADFRR